MSPESLSILGDMLKHVDSNIRDTWARMGMVLCHCDPDPDGPLFALWVEYSKRSDKFPGEPELLNQWRSFSNYRGQRRVGPGTLIREARKGGYTGPIPPAFSQSQAEEEDPYFDVEDYHPHSKAWDIYRKLRTDGSSPYFERKGIHAPKGIACDGETTVVPVWGFGGELRGLQFISPGGEKKFLSGTRKSGGYFSEVAIEEGDPTKTFVIAEGVATAAAISSVLVGAVVLAAFDCGNLVHVAQRLRQRFPNTKIILAADNDAQTAGNPGLTSAQKSARKTAGLVAVPQFQEPDGKATTDFLDLLKLEGPEAVRRCFEQAIPPPSENEGDAQPRPYICTDLGNAERFVDQHGHNMRHCPKRGGWMVWKKTHWSPDETGYAMELGKQTVRSIHTEAGTINDDTKRRQVAKHAYRSEQESSIKAALNLAKSDRRIAAAPSEFDSDPWLMSVQNGTLELHTGAFREHRREDLITKVLPVPYDPGATCPRWRSFLDRIFGSNRRLISYLQGAVGYSLTGITTEQCLFVLYGTGANGKSTLLSVLSALMGDYMRIAAPDLLLARKGDRHPTELADLVGARLVYSVETGEGRMLAENLIKQMTGGEPLKARLMHQNFFTFMPQFKLWLATNHKPMIRGGDEGIWRRLRLIPFSVTIPEEDRDPHLLDKLREELPGIFAWAVEGCCAWQDGGLKPPEEVRDATRDYREEVDPISRFLEDVCVVPAGDSLPGAQLYNAYQSWADANGEYGLSRRAFDQRIEERGFKRHRTARVRCWLGLRLNDFARLSAG